MVGITFDYAGTQVLVTGGSSGIGFGIAAAFATAGAQVTITGTRPTAGDYDRDLSAFAYRRCRLQEADSVAALAHGLARLDVLVNNAGFTLPGGRSEYEPGVFEDVVAANLVAPFRLSVACKPLLAASAIAGGGSIVNLGSIASFLGLANNPGYGAAKAGVVQMTKTLAVAWAREGVRVNAVAPGIVHSNMTAPMMDLPDVTEPILERTPMRRFGTPDDVAPAVLFLASPAARYITGHTLMIDGGRSIQG
jgi:NAD(P)-dependent dehydrogenase (short-subunit alcohol dehydrogenase family)